MTGLITMDIPTLIMCISLSVAAFTMIWTIFVDKAFANRRKVYKSAGPRNEGSFSTAARAAPLRDKPRAAGAVADRAAARKP